MSHVLYLDCASGAAGDMLLAALVDAGASLADLEPGLRALPLERWSWRAVPVQRAGLRACHLQIEVEPGGPSHRTPAEIDALLRDATALPEKVRVQARRVFDRLAQAEARVHGVSVDALVLHEVGQTDALLDVVGVLLALQQLGIEAVYCSPLPLASGGDWGGGSSAGAATVETGYGQIALPAPATLEILSAVQASLRAAQAQDTKELVTPTAAALIAEIARFERPAMRLERVGVGAGTRDLPHRANVLRAWLAQTEQAAGAPAHSVIVLETVVDDMTPEQLAYARERVAAAGALDVWVESTAMKKGRMGWRIAAVARSDAEATLVHALLAETSTLGVRVRGERRYEAAREQREIATPLGPVSVKLKRIPGMVPQIAPEFDDCARLAAAHDLPITAVYALVERAAHAVIDPDDS